MKYLQHFFFLLLISCGQKPTIEPQFMPYVDSFVLECEQYKNNCNFAYYYSIEEVDAEDIQYSFGRCSYGKIQVSKDYWYNVSYYGKEILVFHELGHCFLGRGHNSLRRENNFPVSIMYPQIITYYYEQDRDYYIRELFTGEL